MMEVNTLVLSRFRPDRLTGGAAIRNRQSVCAMASLGPVDVVTIGSEDVPHDVVTELDDIRRWKAFDLKRLNKTRSKWKQIQQHWLLHPARHPAIDKYLHADVVGWIRQQFARVPYRYVVVEELSLARYVSVLRDFECHTIFDAHNVECVLRSDLLSAADSSLKKRIKNQILNRRLATIERQAINGADQVWACSEADATAIREVLGASTPVTVVPNGVNVGSYDLATTGKMADVASPWPEPIHIVYMGAYAYYPNEQAALLLIREVLPQLQSLAVEARLTLVGRHPTKVMQAAAKENSNVQITGEVESVLPYLQGPCVVAIPLQLGSGTRLKILETFAINRPVVSTSKGAEGIDAKDGEHLLIRDSMNEMARAIVKLWQQPQVRSQLCANARDLVEHDYSWDSATRRIVDSLQAPCSAPVS